MLTRNLQDLITREGVSFSLTLKNNKPSNAILGFAWLDAQHLLVMSTLGMEIFNVNAIAQTTKFVKSGGGPMGWYRYLVRKLAVFDRKKIRFWNVFVPFLSPIVHFYAVF